MLDRGVFRKTWSQTLEMVQCLLLVGSRHGIPQERSPDLTLGQLGNEAWNFAIRFIWVVYHSYYLSMIIACNFFFRHPHQWTQAILVLAWNYRIWIRVNPTPTNIFPGHQPEGKGTVWENPEYCRGLKIQARSEIGPEVAWLHRQGGKAGKL